jgi:dihydropteroate synthase
VQNTAFSTNKTLNVNGRLIDLSTPKLMGVLNVTPDSFYDGGRYNDEKAVLERAEKVLVEGATFIDVGGYSSRPGADHISEEEEINRILRPIDVISKNFPELIISIDTFRTSVARAAIDHGASMINDISGGSLDPNMFDLISKLKIPYVLMHMKGDPKTMVSLSVYQNVFNEVLEFFHQRVHQLTGNGINDIIIDPGFGFAKTREQNFELLSQLNKFRILERPLMAGLSRKSMVWKTLGITPEEALNGTTALNTVAVLNGIDILRVHDVKEAAQVITLVREMRDRGSKHEQ